MTCVSVAGVRNFLGSDDCFLTTSTEAREHATSSGGPAAGEAAAARDVAVVARASCPVLLGQQAAAWGGILGGVSCMRLRGITIMARG